MSDYQTQSYRLNWRDLTIQLYDYYCYGVLIFVVTMLISMYMGWWTPWEGGTRRLPQYTEGVRDLSPVNPGHSQRKESNQRKEILII